MKIDSVKTSNAGMLWSQTVVNSTLDAWFYSIRTNVNFKLANILILNTLIIMNITVLTGTINLLITDRANTFALVSAENTVHALCSRSSHCDLRTCNSLKHWFH